LGDQDMQAHARAFAFWRTRSNTDSS
jgi:hypothetical protein